MFISSTFTTPSPFKSPISSDVSPLAVMVTVFDEESEPSPHVSRKLYTPGCENEAAVATAFEFTNVTVPGPTGVKRLLPCGLFFDVFS